VRLKPLSEVRPPSKSRLTVSIFLKLQAYWSATFLFQRGYEDMNSILKIFGLIFLVIIAVKMAPVVLGILGGVMSFALGLGVMVAGVAVMVGFILITAGSALDPRSPFCGLDYADLPSRARPDYGLIPIAIRI